MRYPFKHDPISQAERIYVATVPAKFSIVTPPFPPVNVGNMQKTLMHVSVFKKSVLTTLNRGGEGWGRTRCVFKKTKVVFYWDKPF